MTMCFSLITPLSLRISSVKMKRNQHAANTKPVQYSAYDESLDNLKFQVNFLISSLFLLTFVLKIMYQCPVMNGISRFLLAFIGLACYKLVNLHSLFWQNIILAI